MRYILIFIFINISIIKLQAQDIKSLAGVFGKLPEVTDIKISPDGNKILLLQSYQGRRIVVTKSLVDPNLPVNGIPYEQGEYEWVEWVSNDKILASISFPSERGFGRYRTDTTERRLLYMDWDGKNMDNPIKIRTGGTSLDRRQSQLIPQFQDEVVDFLENDPEHILIQLSLDEPLSPAVYKLNLQTKERDRMIRGRPNIQEWKADNNHIIRYGEGRSRKTNADNIRSVGYYRKKDGDGWDLLFEYDELTEMPPFKFEGFSDDPNVIFISKLNEHNNKAFYSYDVENKKAIDEIASSEIVDINSITVNDKGILAQYTYYEETRKVVNLDKELEGIYKIYNANFPNQLVSTVSSSLDKKKIIVKVTAPDNPGTYYLLDLNQNKMEPIGYNYVELDYEKLSPMNSVYYEARDGLKIHGYLSVPKNREPVNLPVIILPHGGPWARDNWGFNYEVQYLTSLGYAVFQMNYRGSTGYGAYFEAAGHQEWGRKMLSDINDGTKWLIKEGIADPNKICIVGGSYGGYAALQTVIMDSSLYRCSVAWAPVSDLKSFMRYRENYADYRSYENQIVSTEWTLEEASPAHNVDKINIPVLVMHGNIDRSVRVEQSRDFFDIMKKAGKDIDFVEFEDGDHYLSRENHRIDYLMRVGEFLSENLR